MELSYPKCMGHVLTSLLRPKTLQEEFLATSPDGYTLLKTTSSRKINPRTCMMALWIYTDPDQVRTCCRFFGEQVEIRASFTPRAENTDSGKFK